jgi:hypothetical protein
MKAAEAAARDADVVVLVIGLEVCLNRSASVGAILLKHLVQPHAGILGK